MLDKYDSSRFNGGIFVKTKQMNTRSLVLGLIAVFALSACGKNSASGSGATEDSSASGAAAGAAGGALSGSTSSGTQASADFRFQPSLLQSVKSQFNLLPNAFADVSCPTFHTVGTGCQAAGGSMWLSYSDCTFAGLATWSGVQALISSASATCGSFPLPAANGTLIRQFVASAGSLTPGSVTLTTNAGTQGVVDDATANLGNFDGATISTVANGGYGSEVAFNGSDQRSSITVAHHIYANGIFDHSVTGTLTVSNDDGNSRTITGSIKVYHNLLRVVGTSVFNTVGHSNGCCFPTSGSITTTFSQGNNVLPTALGRAALGKSETLTFTGCGTASLQSYDGSTATVTLDRCF
jgi:hypothetical protein